MERQQVERALLDAVRRRLAGPRPPGEVEALLAEFFAQGGEAELPTWLVDRGLLTAPEACALLEEVSTDTRSFAVGEATPLASEAGGAGGDDLAGSDTRTSMTFEDPRLGRTFSGFRIELLLGRGGMGAVYLARGERGEQAVVKFIASEHIDNDVLRARFAIEAEALSRVDHPNVVRLLTMDTQGPEPHLVLEYVEGRSLEHELRERWTLPPLEAAAVARDLALGLAEAHRHGIVHRDVKPANVLRLPDGRVKLVDFGLAKDVFLTGTGITRPGQAVGTPYYMAPEQWGEHLVDVRCDLFALGATLYHLVIGEPPFRGETAEDVAALAIAGQYTRPRDVLPGLPEDLELVICKLLMAERTFRYPGATACAEDLQRVLAGETVRVARLIDRRPGRPRRFPLVPGTSWTLGRAEECDIVLGEPSVSGGHARVERDVSGFVLRDLGSSYGTCVNGMRVREVALKDGDVLRLGRLELLFRDDGCLGPPRQATPAGAAARPGRLQLVPTPDAVLRTLRDLGDRRLLLTLLEQLAPFAAEERLNEVRAELTPLVGLEVTDRVAARLAEALAHEQRVLPMRLFSLTQENLGGDPEAWLRWWDEHAAELPPQLVPELAHEGTWALELARGRVEKQSRLLAPGDAITVGRDPQNALCLPDLSVSREHARICALHRRLVVFDRGSRFGTQVAWRRVREAFVPQGARIALGKIELAAWLRRAEPAAAEAAGLGKYLIDPEAFDLLERSRHPATATALVRFLHQERRLEWVSERAAGLFDDPERARSFASACRRWYRRRARRARGYLPEVLGVEGERSDEAWTQLLAERRSGLPPQVLPRGWFPRD